MIQRPRIGVLGGTFDPIHVGHLAAAHASHRALHLDRIRFIPSSRPPHRPDSPRAAGYHRLEMVRLAVGDVPGWEASDLELRRGGPSYTFDTLTALHRDGVRPLQIFFLTGADAFAEIATWRDYPRVLDAAHFAVIARPGTALGELRQRLPDLARRMIDPASIDRVDTPSVILVEAATPDVSSTEVRRRVVQGTSIADVVPARVADYIHEHSLYRDPVAGTLPEAAGTGR